MPTANGRSRKGARYTASAVADVLRDANAAMRGPDGAAAAGAAVVRFTVGQAVYWPHAHLRTAQVDELRRTCVRLVYARRRGGGLRFATVRADRLAAMQASAAAAAGDVPILRLMHNPLARGALARTKEFPIAAPGGDARKGAK